MKWLSNTYNPSSPNAYNRIHLMFGQSGEEAWQNHLDWLKDKIISRPKASDKYTVEQLEEMGMVGVYSHE